MLAHSGQLKKSEAKHLFVNYEQQMDYKPIMNRKS